MKQGGCWIFLSHSSHDMAKVRIIRNEFEKYSHNPLAFHLRCLNDDTAEGKLELSTLIKREIDCREWFVFCESPAAAQSEYVQMEKAYIIETGKQKVWSINMSLPLDEILTKVKEICTAIRVFISYNKSDSFSFYKTLSNALIEKDFDVWDSESLVVGTSFLDETFAAIEKTAENGFAVVLITEEYVQSHCCLMELESLVSSKVKLIPLVFEGVEIPALLDKTKCFRIPNIPKSTDVGLIVELIEAILKTEIVGPIMHWGDEHNKINAIYENLNYTNRYHPQEAVLVKSTGACDDYLEIYKFPCCGRIAVVGTGPVSRFRSDGCCCDAD